VIAAAVCSVRAPGDHGSDETSRRAADLLLTTNGTGPLGRFVPRLTSTAEHASYGSSLPYRAPNGPLLLAARAFETLRRFALCVASPLGRWRRFRTLVLEPLEAARDADIDFDAMLNVLPGLPPYDWVRRLREGAYAAARRSRVRPA
jgi:hypothetical protein